MPVANKQKLIFTLEILVINNPVVFNVETKVAFIFDDWLVVGELVEKQSRRSSTMAGNLNVTYSGDGPKSFGPRRDKILVQ